MVSNGWNISASPKLGYSHHQKRIEKSNLVETVIMCEFSHIIYMSYLCIYIYYMSYSRVITFPSFWIFCCGVPFSLMSPSLCRICRSFEPGPTTRRVSSSRGSRARLPFSRTVRVSWQPWQLLSSRRRPVGKDSNSWHGFSPFFTHTNIQQI